ncbi:MAG: hypothetical protein ABIK09_12630 [Pseudomonadota bacterium]
MRQLSSLLSLVLLFAACGGGGSTISTEDVAPDAASDATVDGLDEDAEEPLDATPDGALEVASDVPSEAVLPECDPGEGCFLDACAGNGDCQSGWCVEHMGEGVCTKTCQDDCPPGWSCRQAGADGPDVQFICISGVANLCKPCGDNADCKSVGGADDLCLDYGGEGSFCGGLCEGPDDCPWGFSCVETATVEGVQVTQCLADAGICPCTGTSVALSLATPCAVENEWGACVGLRVCTGEGLTSCDASAPVAETCNGLDDDCDGAEDEPGSVGGDLVNLCDDGNPCTTDSCNGEAGCSHEALEGGECVDGDPCTAGDHCTAGTCVGSPVLCDDNDPCTDDSCNGLGGCLFEPNSASCDDGDPCTVGDQCAEGACTGIVIPCDCQVDADCAALEDEDLCNGTLVCDNDAIPFQCMVDPETVITCPEAPEGLDAICLQAACDPQNGACGLIPDHEGYACDDGDPCTLGDACAEGACAGGAGALCDDGNLCTDDVCSPLSGCTFTPNDAGCDDGNPCTTGDQCGNGWCGAAEILDCDDGDPCTDDGCSPLSGCVYTMNTALCDDGDLCTTADHCQSGLCVAGGVLGCDDGNPCTDDGCSAPTGCVFVPNDAPCDDGNVCTTSSACAGGVCVGVDGKDCDDGNLCTDDECSPLSGCVSTPNEVGCDDGNACTAVDQCANGWCVGAGALDCDDEDPCTDDSCAPQSGCVYTLNTAPCNDADLCTTDDHCHLGSCIGGGLLGCDDGNLCTDDACAPLAGCTFTPNDDGCDDGNLCTTGDHCAAGGCQGGGLLSCDDLNPCTDDYCDIVAGCLNVPNTAPCNDGNACTANEVCANEACGGGVPIVCLDENPCTDDACAPSIGCVFTANTVPCTDGDACTDGDLCADSACVPGGDLDCDDANVCTDDACAPASGCTHDPVADETSCGVEKWCQAGICQDICAAGPGTQTFSFNGSLQTFTVPDCVDTLVIEAWGAQGGMGNAGPGGKGARMKGSFAVLPGQQFKVMVGGQPSTATASGGHIGNSTGGGGGSFVTTLANAALLVAGAGGGGGAVSGGLDGVTGTDGVHGLGGGGASGGTNGGGGGADGGMNSGRGGGGLTGDGGIPPADAGVASGGSKSFVNGGAGGPIGPHQGAGGFGGGGQGGNYGGGGGGGYSGGGGGSSNGYGGGGGGSYNGGGSPDNAAGVRTGHGQVTISW